MNTMTDFQDNYSLLDKALYYFAFKTRKIQLAISNQESLDYKEDLQLQHIKKPVFITSLPRSGTTILLNILTKTDRFCYQSYSDMPFVYTPLIWAKYNRLFSRVEELQERAHQDGIKINTHSAEAFEEMFWKAFCPEAYLSSSISPWLETANEKFDIFFSEHIKKLMLRDKQNGVDGPIRYLSKNNLNICRLPYIKNLFPDSLVVIPFREPLQHAVSLLNQHRNFMTLHQHNKFSKHYMAEIGHFDFGVNLKPVNFNNWFIDTCFTPDSLDFWLEYWIQTYQYLLQNIDHASHFFIGLDELSRHPQASFEHLAEYLSIEPHTLLKSIPMVQVAKKHTVDTHLLNQKNIQKSEALYQQMLNIS